MKRTITTAFCCLVAVGGMCQQALWGGQGVESPAVNADRSVTFRLFAPNAQKVEVEGDFLPPRTIQTPMGEMQVAGRAGLAKADNGLWQYTTPPLEPELYSYTFIADGIKMTDPNNVYQLRDVASVTNIFIIDGDPGTTYSVQDVPHGTLAKVWYDSPTLGLTRRMTIYTPPGYADGTQRYPVLYLLHGAGGDENAWSELGRTAQIMDNLIAQGKAKPMIVVMTNGNPSQQAAPGEAYGNMKKPVFTVEGLHDGRFEKSFADVMAYVESHYRTIADKQHRAIAGLSMGGFHSKYISAYYPDRFDYVGLFSAAIKTDYDSDVYNNFDANLARQFGTPPALYWIAIGRTDFLYADNVEYRRQLDKLGYAYKYVETDGGHIWRNWRIYLTQFAQLIFK